MLRPLDGDEETLAGLVARLGLSVAAARCFAALARGGGHTLADLVAATGLARQEAGEAARELEAAGLARVDKVPSGGRPLLRYHLAKDEGAEGEGLLARIAARREEIRDELAKLDELEARFR